VIWGKADLGTTSTRRATMVSKTKSAEIKQPKKGAEIPPNNTCNNSTFFLVSYRRKGNFSYPWRRRLQENRRKKQQHLTLENTSQQKPENQNIAMNFISVQTNHWAFVAVLFWWVF